MVRERWLFFDVSDGESWAMAQIYFLLYGKLKFISYDTNLGVPMIY